MVEASPRRIYANAHTYHINSISVNSDAETYLSADDLRINLWHLDITDQSFNIVDIKPANMEELTEVITAAEFHPTDCNNFVYSSSKGLIRLCDMRMAALCDRHAKCNYRTFQELLLLVFFFSCTPSMTLAERRMGRLGAIPLSLANWILCESKSCREQAFDIKIDRPVALSTEERV